MNKNNGQKLNNKGFTLVELIIVLVLMAIILGITVAGGLGWQDWARFNHENSLAEEIFFAAQNQLTELDSSNSMDVKVISKLRSTSDDGSDYSSDIVLSNSLLSEIGYEYKEDGVTLTKYNWDKIWVLNKNPETEKGTILRLKAENGDYDKYLAGTLVTKTDKSKLGAKILFDLVSAYVSDKNALNGAIILEFSPEAGQVFSVCYSDNVDVLLYDGETAGDGKKSLSVMNRALEERRKIKLGYYSVNELAQKIRGKAQYKAELSIELKNENVLELVVTDKATKVEKKLSIGDSLVFKLYNANTDGDLMSFTMPYDDNLPNFEGDSDGVALEKAARSPVTIKCTFYSGKYNEKSDVEFRVPAWRNGNKIHIVLDAADVQAQSLSYAKSIYFSGNEYESETETAFRNTYSFYRFGLADVSQYVYADVYVQKIDWSKTESVKSNKEYATFASYNKTDDEAVIELANARHLYNVRYETDYKRNINICNTFILVNDISWNDFIGQSETTDGTNYFLNSYSTEKASGINYDGLNFATRSMEKTLDTKNYPFPGFRKLDSKDIFTQGNPEDESETTKYAISDLTLSVSANIVYGVYGNKIKSDCMPSEQEDYSAILGLSDEEALDSTGSNAARGGNLPLGLFAENIGEISNIILNRHVVDGFEKVNESVVYTCMVGGFTGNNLGKLENLILLDNVENDAKSAKANRSRISGRTDVGGILGRESYALTEADADKNLKNLKNYSTVTGLENVGGIVGRVYVNVVSSEDAENPRYKFYHDGYTITDEHKSLTVKKVVPDTKVTLEECINRGYVYGLSSVKEYKDLKLENDNIADLRCSFIGGIAGITMDGHIYDYEEGTIKEAYLDGSDENVIVRNCNSYVAYKAESDEDIVKLTSTDEHPALLHDNYVGGLIGYGRLTIIENCNTKPDEEMMSGEAASAFVFGNRYVGGLVGCSDMCKYKEGNQENSDTEEEKKIYTATNYNNVIGRFIVGGIAGANGIGAINQHEFSFRNPSVNLATPASSVYEDKDLDLVYNLLNKGAVLTLKTEVPFTDKLIDGWKDTAEDAEIYNDDKLTGICGGIVGMNCAGIKGCDNIQSEDTKHFIERLVTGNTETDLYSKDTDALDIYNVISGTNQKFGGNAIGGIVGYQTAKGYINQPDTEPVVRHTSYIDAIIFGQDYVGGGFGISTNEEKTASYDIHPYKSSDTSSGMLVVGDDVVGGVAGRVGGYYHSQDKIQTHFKVKGKMAVGGAFGALSGSELITASMDIDGSDENNFITVDGVAYVGGYVGLVDGDNVNVSIAPNAAIGLDKTKVKGNYFVGGFSGAVTNDGNGLDKLSKNDQNTIPFTVGSYLSVEADAFAGGISGLYNIDKEKNGLYKVSDSGKEDGYLYKIISGLLSDNMNNIPNIDASAVQSSIVNADIDENGINNKEVFEKDETAKVITFNDYYDNQGYSNRTMVESGIFAGGLFGYVPNGINLTVEGFKNQGSIRTKDTVSATNVNEDSSQDKENVKYSYLGGVIGRVPSGMKLINCKNNITGSDIESKIFYTSYATYLGGITEVNAGVITGIGDIDGNSEISDSEYLETEDISRSYTNIKMGALAGINGTKYTSAFDADGNLKNDATGLIRFCKNTGSISVSGDMADAAGIAAAVSGNSAILDCVNTGKITGKYSAGIVAEAVSGDSVIVSCENSADISGSTGASGILCRDIGTTVSKVDNCVNNGIIASDSKAAGIVCEDISDYQTGTDSICYIKDCINHGEIQGNEENSSAAGIMVSSTSDSLKIDSCVNTGIMRINEKLPYDYATAIADMDKESGAEGSDSEESEESPNSLIKAAGIVCDTSGKGVIRLCRNYGVGLYYGITMGEAKSIHYCLDSSLAKKHIGDIADSTVKEDKFANYYIGGEQELPSLEKRFKVSLTTPNGETNETNEISKYVLRLGQTEKELKHHKEAGVSVEDNPESKPVTYTIEPVNNVSDLSNTYIDIDNLSILWDNYDKAEIDDYMAPYVNREDHKAEEEAFKSNFLSTAVGTINKVEKFSLPGWMVRIIKWLNPYFDESIFDNTTGIDLRNKFLINAETYPEGYVFIKYYFSDEYSTDWYNNSSLYNNGSANQFDYFSNYAFATYYNLLQNDDFNNAGEEEQKLIYQTALITNADRYGKVSYMNTLKDYTLTYKIKIYNNTDDDDPSNDVAAISKDIVTTIRSKNDDSSEIIDFYPNDISFTPLENSAAIRVKTDINDGAGPIVTDIRVDHNKITRVDIIVTKCVDVDTDSNYRSVGIRAFKWKQDETDAPTEGVIMPCYDPDDERPENPFSGVNDIKTLVNRVSDTTRSDNIFEPESVLYYAPNAVTGETIVNWQLMMYSYPTGIKDLTFDTWNTQREACHTDTYPFKGSVHRSTVYNDIDKQFVDFINSLGLE